MHPIAWLLSITWLLLTALVAVFRGIRGYREGRGHLFQARLRSPTIYLFSAYLLVAALVTPPSPGETTSPLLWLAIAIPLANVLSSLSAIGQSHPKGSTRLFLALLHGGAVLAAAALILAVVSPKFVPTWLTLGPRGLSAPLEPRTSVTLDPVSRKCAKRTSLNRSRQDRRRYSKALTVVAAFCQEAQRRTA